MQQAPHSRRKARTAFYVRPQLCAISVKHYWRWDNVTYLFSAQLQELRRRKGAFASNSAKMTGGLSAVDDSALKRTTQRKLRTAAQSSVQNYCGQCFVDNVVRHAKHPFSNNLGTNAQHTDCIENTSSLDTP